MYVPLVLSPKNGWIKLWSKVVDSQSIFFPILLNYYVISFLSCERTEVGSPRIIGFATTNFSVSSVFIVAKWPLNLLRQPLKQQNKSSNLPSDVRSFLWKCWCDNNVLLQLAVHYSVGFHLCGFHYLILRFLFVYFQFFQSYLQGGMEDDLALANLPTHRLMLFYSFQHHGNDGTRRLVRLHKSHKNRCENSAIFC